MKKFNEIEYVRPNVDELCAKLGAIVDEFKTADSKRQIELVLEVDGLKRNVYTASSIAYIRYTVDTRDEFFKNEMEFFDEAEPKLQEKLNEFVGAMLDSPHRSELEERFGNHIFNLYEMERKIFDPTIMEDLIEENKTTNEYSNLIGSAQIDFEGEKYTLSRLAPLMQSTDRDMRKRANEAYYGFFEENMDKFDDIYDRLVGIRDRIAKKLGFKNFIELGYLRMNRSEYGATDVSNFRDAVLKHMVPYASELIERQKTRLGMDELYYYDEVLKYNSGNPTPKGNPEWMLERGKEMYEKISPLTSEFFNFMTQYELFDLYSRDGKMSGGYCTTIADYKAQFIFANMNGTSHDVDVLTHEAGHAFQGYLSKDLELAEYMHPTYEACEIHSMSMEFFAYPHIDLFFEEDIEKYKFSHMAGTMEFIPYGSLVDHFQHLVYENPEMTPTERRKLFRDLERKYLPHRNYGDNEFLENGGFFFRQNHIFLRPFYYIDYCLAQICAIGYFKKSKEDYSAAFENYVELCKLGGSLPFLELVETTGLGSPFEESTIESAVSTIKEELDEIDDKKF